MIDVKPVRPLLAYAIAAVLVVAGVVIARAWGAAAAFGWFAYSPEAPAELDRLVAWSRARIAAAALVLGGLLLAAFTTGALAARRGTRRRPLPLVVAALLLLVGVVVFVVATRDLALTISVPLSVWGPGQLAGAALITLGALLAVFTIGQLAGNERRPARVGTSGR